MIGKYYEKSPISYERLGQDLGFTHLNLDESLYNEFLATYGEDAWWPYVNEPFVWKVAMQQKPVYVNVNPTRVLPEGNLYAELQALRQFGYTEGGTEILNGIMLWKLVPGR